MKAFDKNGILLSDNRRSFFTYESGTLTIDGSTVPLVLLINKGSHVQISELNFKKTIGILLPEKTWLFCDSDFNVYETRIQPLGSRSTPPDDAVNGSFYFDSVSMRGKKLVNGIWQFHDSIPIAYVSGEYIEIVNPITNVPGFGNHIVGNTSFTYKKLTSLQTSEILDQQNIPVDALVSYGIANEPIARGQPVSLNEFRCSLAINKAADGISLFDAPQYGACICISEGTIHNMFDDTVAFRAFLSDNGSIASIPNNRYIYQALGHVIDGDFQVSIKTPEYLQKRSPIPPSSTPAISPSQITPTPTRSATPIAASPTPTATTTATPSITPSATPSATPSTTATATPPATPQITVTPSTSNTPPTPTPAPTTTPTPSPSSGALFGCVVEAPDQRLTEGGMPRITEDGTCRLVDSTN